jgi:hypothetical protein
MAEQYDARKLLQSLSHKQRGNPTAREFCSVCISGLAYCIFSVGFFILSIFGVICAADESYCGSLGPKVSPLIMIGSGVFGSLWLCYFVLFNRRNPQKVFNSVGRVLFICLPFYFVSTFFYIFEVTLSALLVAYGLAHVWVSKKSHIMPLSLKDPLVIKVPSLYSTTSSQLRASG